MFKKKKITSTTIPSGLSIKIDGQYFLVKNGTLLRYYSERVFKSWRVAAIAADSSLLAELGVGGQLGFRDGTLALNYSDGKMYLISDRKRRLLANPNVWEKYGLSKANMIAVSQSEIDLHKEGDMLE